MISSLMSIGTISVPYRTSQHINLGWVGDCIIGTGGAFVIFLITPNLSEGLADGQLDTVEVIAVATVGGFSGRAIIQTAADYYKKTRPKDA